MDTPINLPESLAANVQRDYLEPFLLEGLKSVSSTPMTQADWDYIRTIVHKRQKQRRNDA